MYSLEIHIQQNEYCGSGKVLTSVIKYKDFQRFCPQVGFLPRILFNHFFEKIKNFLDCTQIYFFARAQFTPDTFSEVTCNFNDKPKIAEQEVKDFFCHVCRFFEDRKKQVVQTIWQAYDGASNVVINFYYKVY